MEAVVRDVRGPSSRVLINRVDIYQATEANDDAGGVQFIYPGSPTFGQVPCTIQAGAIEEVIDEQERITQLLHYKIMFSMAISVTPRDKLVYQDPAGVTRELFVEVQRDEAGRQAAYTVRAVERI